MTTHPTTLTLASEIASCAEWDRLYDLFISALRDAIELEQSLAELPEEYCPAHVERMLGEAANRTRCAKTRLMAHLRSHAGCGREPRDQWPNAAPVMFPLRSLNP